MKACALAFVLAAAPVFAEPIIVDAAAIAQLEAVQQSVNALPVRSDQDRFGRIEYWQSADATGGDCEDKALAARDALITLGWPAHALRLALAWDETGTYHAVLTVDLRTTAGTATWVLDSRFAGLQTWSALARRGYRWSVRQSSSTGWQRVGG